MGRLSACLVAATLAGCGGNAGLRVADVSQEATTSSATIPEQEVHGDGGWPVVAVDGGYYNYWDHGCAVPNPQSLTGPELEPPGDRNFDAARVVPSAPQELVIAVHQSVAGVPCRDTLDGWILVFSAVKRESWDEAAAWAEVRCELPAQAEHQRCPEGGPFHFYPPDENASRVTRMAWSASGIRRANDAVRAGEPNRHADPLDAVALVIEPESLPDELDPDEFLYRSGLALREQAGSRATVDWVTQRGRICSGTGPCWSTSTQRYTLEQLGGGPGWWVVSYTWSGDSDPLGQGQLDAIDPNPVESAWANCCDHVLVDLERDPAEVSDPCGGPCPTE